MAELVFTNAKFVVDGNDFSNKVKQVTLTYNAEPQDKTTMGPDGTRVFKGGLKNWSMDVVFNSDFADDGLDEKLFALVGTEHVVAVRPVNTTISAANPEYTGTGLLVDYPPLGGTVGAMAEATARWQAAGVLTRDITP